jgi:hypothetical protein
LSVLLQFTASDYKKKDKKSLYMDREEISTLYRELPIDASYQVSVHLAKQFQRRRILEIDQSGTRISCGGQASMENPLLRLLISSRSINKHGHHRQFLFLIG